MWKECKKVNVYNFFGIYDFPLKWNDTIRWLQFLSIWKSANNKNRMKMAIEQLADIKRERVTQISICS